MRPASQHFTVEQMGVLRRARDLALKGGRSVRVPARGWLVVPDVLVVEAAANGWVLQDGFELREDGEAELDGRVVLVYTFPVPS